MAIKPKKTTETKATDDWPYGKKNYIVFAAAIVIIIIGFILLGQGSDTFSVILLVFGYCVLIPTALMLKDKNETTTEESPDSIT